MDKKNVVWGLCVVHRLLDLNASLQLIVKKKGMVFIWMNNWGSPIEITRRLGHDILTKNYNIDSFSHAFVAVVRHLQNFVPAHQIYTQSYQKRVAKSTVLLPNWATFTLLLRVKAISPLPPQNTRGEVLYSN